MLAGLAAAFLLAAPRAGGADFRALDVLELEYSSVTRRIETGFPGLRRARAGVLTAPDPEARLAVVLARQSELGALFGRAVMLQNRHNKELAVQGFASITRGLISARAKSPKPGLEDVELVGHKGVGDEMQNKNLVLGNQFDDETLEIDKVKAALDQRREARQRRPLRVWGVLLVCAAAAFLLRLARVPAAPRVPPPPFPPEAPGNFKVVGLLGRGGMGDVYQAVDKTLDRPVALKRLRAELVSDPVGLAGLLNEARLMAALKHPNMLDIYSVEKDAGQVYLAMEFVDGVTLQRRLDVEGRLPWPEGLRVARGVGAALDYAHGMKVVHRDLKPSNIMLSLKGEVKVTDFGIAYQAAKSVSRLTRAPSWGTPPYMAPEQELGGVSAAVDLYALAVCLYEMLGGELPFKGPNFLAQKRESLYAPVSRLAPGLPAGIDGFFAVALAPEPSRRFKSAADLLAACAAF